MRHYLNMIEVVVSEADCGNDVFIAGLCVL